MTKPICHFFWHLTYKQTLFLALNYICHLKWTAVTKPICHFFGHLTYTFDILKMGHCSEIYTCNFLTKTLSVMFCNVLGLSFKMDPFDETFLHHYLDLVCYIYNLKWTTVKRTPFFGGGLAFAGILLHLSFKMDHCDKITFCHFLKQTLIYIELSILHRHPCYSLSI